MVTLNAQKPSKEYNGEIVWIDLELTGLDVETCHIMEIACLITDDKLNILSKDLDIVIHQPDSILNNMNEWCTKFHGKTGLTDACRNSKITLKEAEEIVLKHVQQYVPEKKCPLAGNSVYMDRLFLYKYMPSVNEYLHYRIIDVSTVKELVKRWKPTVSELEKEYAHRALSDIHWSIKELDYYRKHLFMYE